MRFPFSCVCFVSWGMIASCYASESPQDAPSSQKEKPSQAGHAVQIVSVSQVATLVDHQAATLVDARSKEAYTKGHIPGALSIPFDSDVPTLKKALPDLHAPIVVYCGSIHCPVGPQLARRLVDIGYTNVSEFSAGIKGWQDVHKPIEK